MQKNETWYSGGAVHHVHGYTLDIPFSIYSYYSLASMKALCNIRSEDLNCRMASARAGWLASVPNVEFLIGGFAILDSKEKGVVRRTFVVVRMAP